MLSLCFQECVQRGVSVSVCVRKHEGLDSDEVKDLIKTSNELLCEYRTVDVYFLRKRCRLTFLLCVNVLFST